MAKKGFLVLLYIMYTTKLIYRELKHCFRDIYKYILWSVRLECRRVYTNITNLCIMHIIFTRFCTDIHIVRNKVSKNNVITEHRIIKYLNFTTAYFAFYSHTPQITIGDITPYKSISIFFFWVRINVLSSHYLLITTFFFH